MRPGENGEDGGGQRPAHTPLSSTAKHCRIRQPSLRHPPSGAPAPFPSRCTTRSRPATWQVGAGITVVMDERPDPRVASPLSQGFAPPSPPPAGAEDRVATPLFAAFSSAVGPAASTIGGHMKLGDPSPTSASSWLQAASFTVAAGPAPVRRQTDAKRKPAAAATGEGPTPADKRWRGDQQQGYGESAQSRQQKQRWVPRHCWWLWCHFPGPRYYGA